MTTKTNNNRKRWGDCKAVFRPCMTKLRGPQYACDKCAAVAEMG